MSIFERLLQILNRFELPILLACFTLIAIARFLWLGNYPIATSNDAGNWLNGVRIILGDSWLNFHRNSISLFASIPLYNLLTPWVPFLPLSILVKVFDAPLALKVFMVIASVIPGPSFYFLFKSVGVRSWIALILSIIFLFFTPFATMFAWGNYDGLFGLSFFLLSIAFLLRFQQSKAKIYLGLLILSAGLTAGSDDMFFLCLVLSVAIFSGFFLVRRELVSLSDSLIGLVCCLVGSVPFWPVYYDIFVSRAVSTSSVQSLSSIARQILQSALPVAANDWYLITLLFFISWFLLNVKDFRRDLCLAISIASVFEILTFFSYRSVRFVYLISIPIFLAFAVSYERLYVSVPRRALDIFVSLTSDTIHGFQQQAPTRNFHVSTAGLNHHLKTVLTIFLVLLFLATLFSGYQSTVNAYHYYEDLSAPKIQALQWISTNTPTSSLFIASANIPSSPHLDFWINSLGARNAIGEDYAFVPNEPDLSFSNETSRAHFANFALKGNLFAENGMLAIEDSFPFNTTLRPIISAYVGDYEPMLYLNWQSLELNVTGPSGNHLAIGAGDLSPVSSEVFSNGSIAGISYEYKDAILQSSLLVNESVKSGARYVNINYHFTSSSGYSLTGVSGSFNFTAPTVFGLDSNSNASLTLIDKFGNWHPTNISFFSNSSPAQVSITNSSVVSPFRAANYFRLPFVTFRLPVDSNNRTGSRFSFLIDIGGVPENSILPVTHTLDEIQKMLGYNYAFLVNYNSDRSSFPCILQWLELDFTQASSKLVYQNSQVYIFQIQATPNT